MAGAHVGMIGRHVHVVNMCNERNGGWIFVVAGERRGQITEGKLVNMPVYLIVSSHSVTCNYIIMAEGKNTADESFNLLCRCLQSAVLFICGHGNQSTNKTKCDKRGLVLVFFCPRRALTFIWTFVVGPGGGGEKKNYYSRLIEWILPSWGGPLLSSPYKCLAPVAIPSFLHARAVKTGMM